MRPERPIERCPKRAWLVLLAASGCSAGTGGASRPDPEVDAAVVGEPDAAVAPAEPEGQFLVVESSYAAARAQSAVLRGLIQDPRPRFHELVAASGPCRLWRFDEGRCATCDGVCTADDSCVATPELQAGTLVVTIDGRERRIPFRRSGYLVTTVPPNLFEDGSEVSVTAPGSDEASAFSVATLGVDQIVVDLQAVSGSTSSDTLLLTDGADLEITWSPTVPDARVRLQLVTKSSGIGQPAHDLLSCEVDDTGSLVVPRALVEAFPQGLFARGCQEDACPPSSLTRLRSARVDAGGRTMELRVEASRLFNVLHPAP